MNALLYSGFTREEYHALIEDAVSENTSSLKYFSLTAGLFFIVLTFCDLMQIGFLRKNLVYYVLMAGISIAVYVLTKTVLPRCKKLTMPLAYLFLIGMYAVAIVLSLLHPELPALTIIALMLISPFLFTDSPVWIVSLNVITTVVLCVLVAYFKDPVLALDDTWNAASFCAISVAAAFLQRALRFRSLSQARQIRYLSETDLLTGAKNRNTYEQMINVYPKKCKTGLVCVFADVNGLHRMNDTNGHMAGDAMLKNVAEAFIAEFGNRDFYRIGGDEFAAFMPDGSIEDVRIDVKKICDDLSKQGYDVSVGISGAGSGEINMKDLMQEAEKEMYVAKQEYYERSGQARRID